MGYSKLIAAVASAMAAIAGGTLPAQGQDREGVFHLGEIVVVGADEGGAPVVGGAVVTQEDIWTFEKNTLDQAVNLVPGVSSTLDSNGRRNETDIFVRGFGRWQVPMMIDGVRVYLPADNRLDFSRFLTTDVAEIQIQKGYASVLDGPGAMGGAINLVTRKPVKPFEAEVQAGISLNRRSDVDAWNGYARMGSRQSNYYVQGSVSYSDRDSWTMSKDYDPVPGSLEDGGKRLNSDTEDWRVNLKAGYTPNDTDEYTVNYIRQSGEKGGLLNVYNNPPVPPNSYWRWPWWDVESLALLTRTQLDASSYLKTKVYYNTFENALYAYDDITYSSQSNPGRFRSMYEDSAYGLSIEMGRDLTERNTLKGAVHYRKDMHTEWNDNRPTNPVERNIEPKHDQAQTTWSVALENTYRATPDVDLIAGISYDDFSIDKAEEFSSGTGSIFEYPKGGSDAFNWQAAAIWRYSNTGRAHASVSDRSRFPGIWELYSTRFGTAEPNPDLGPERATNYEIGLSETFANVRFTGAVFYSDVRDLIQTVVLTSGNTQTRNVGDGEFYGYEFAVEVPVSNRLLFGGNYTYLHRTINDALQPDLKPTGVPKHRAFLYLTWQPMERLLVTPSVETASARWSDVNTSPAQAFPYTRTGDHTLLNIQAEYRVTDALELAIGARNLLDEHHELAWGLPQPGRNFYLKARMTF